jgi:hypothetical protein
MLRVHADYIGHARSLIPVAIVGNWWRHLIAVRSTRPVHCKTVRTEILDKFFDQFFSGRHILLPMRLKIGEFGKK